MKLLFDENLSPQLVLILADLFPDSSHVHTLFLGNTDDNVIWNYAKTNGYTLVSKDSDHYELSMLYSHPPKVIWIRLGNCNTQSVAQQLRAHHPAILNFHSDPDQSAFLLT